MEEKEIYEKAVDKWGLHLQYLMLIEEMSELAKELIKIIRRKGSLESVEEEIADVDIMLNQIKLFYPEWGIQKIKKLHRLEDMLKEDGK